MDKIAVLKVFAVGLLIGIAITIFSILILRKIKFSKILGNLENIILILALVMFTISLAMDYFKKTNGISVSLLNFFATIIFSWILTKKSSGLSFKIEQEKLAKLSYRHLGDVEKSVLGLEQNIRDYLDENVHKHQNNDSSSYFLGSLLNRTEDIRNGILSNKEDWFDMLSNEEKDRIRERDDPENDFFEQLLHELENMAEEDSEDEESEEETK